MGIDLRPEPPKVCRLIAFWAVFWAIILPTFGVQEGPLGRLLEAAVGLPRKTSGLGLEDHVGLPVDISS